MTIGVGFLCRDGIVIGSDRQLTIQGAYKFNQRKISYMHEAVSDTTMALTYAGDEAAAKSFWAHLMSETRKELQKGTDASVFPSERLQQFLEKTHQHRSAKYLQTIIGIKSGVLGSGLFRGHYKLVSPSHSAEYIGAGDTSVLRYAAELLVHPLMPVSEASVIASYLVRLANRFVDGCGGGPDITVIRWDTEIVTEGSGGAIINEDQRFAYCEQQVGVALRDLLLSGGTKEVITRSVVQKSEDRQ